MILRQKLTLSQALLPLPPACPLSRTTLRHLVKISSQGTKLKAQTIKLKPQGTKFYPQAEKNYASHKTTLAAYKATSAAYIAPNASNKTTPAAYKANAANFIPPSQATKQSQLPTKILNPPRKSAFRPLSSPSQITKKHQNHDYPPHFHLPHRHPRSPLPNQPR